MKRPPLSPLRNVVRAAGQLASASRYLADAFDQLAETEEKKQAGEVVEALPKPKKKKKPKAVDVTPNDIEAARERLRGAGAKV